MSLSNRQRAVGAVAYGMVRGMTEAEIVDRLSDDGLLAPTPQIVRTPADLEALDPDTMLIDNLGIPRTPTSRSLYYPAAVVRDGAGVRACREALEGEAK